MDADKAPSKIQQLKAQLAAHGLSPRKMFGQNFMVDTNFAAAVARDAAPDDKTVIVEIGPGTGCLTAALLAAHPAARVLAIEIDRGLAALLRETFAAEIAGGRLTLLEGDALESKHQLSHALVEALERISTGEQRPRRVVCANLPYNVGTPIIVNIAVDMQDTRIERIVATVQREVADRLQAKRGGGDYSALSALLALRGECRILRRVGNEIFWPRPTIDSAVIGVTFKPWGEQGGLRRDEAQAFQEFLQKLFSQRRKTLRAVLKPVAVPAALNLSTTARAEELAPEMLLQLFRALG